MFQKKKLEIISSGSLSPPQRNLITLHTYKALSLGRLDPALKVASRLLKQYNKDVEHNNTYKSDGRISPDLVPFFQDLYSRDLPNYALNITPPSFQEWSNCSFACALDCDCDVHECSQAEQGLISPAQEWYLNKFHNELLSQKIFEVLSFEGKFTELAREKCPKIFVNALEVLQNLQTSCVYTISISLINQLKRKDLTTIMCSPICKNAFYNLVKNICFQATQQNLPELTEFEEEQAKNFWELLILGFDSGFVSNSNASNASNDANETNASASANTKSSNTNKNSNPNKKNKSKSKSKSNPNESEKEIKFPTKWNLTKLTGSVGNLDVRYDRKGNF